MKYQKTAEFSKDLKKLSKKFITLEEDLETAKINAIELFHVKDVNNLSVFLIPGFSFEKVKIFKLKKFSCKALKGRGVKSGIRVIYAFYPGELLIDFIEMYYKADQVNEDKERINSYLKTRSLA